MTTLYPNGRWNATTFFQHLTATNRLAKSENFTFCQVSGLDGFEEALDNMQQSLAFVCVSDIANGYTELYHHLLKLHPPQDYEEVCHTAAIHSFLLL